MLRFLAGCLLLLCFTSADSASRDTGEKITTTPPADNQEPQLEALLLEAGLPAWLLGADGEIVFEADEISIGEDTYRQVNVPISFSQSSVQVKDASVGVFNGTASLGLTIDRVQQTFAATLQLRDVHLKTDLDSDITNDDDKFIFDDTVLVPNWTKNLNGTIDVKASDSQVDDIELRNVNARVNADANSLDVKLNSTTNNGSLQGAISHRFDTEKTDIDIQGQSVPLSLLPATRAYVDNIHIDFSLDVITVGTSMRQWVSGMSGEIITEFDDGVINIKKLEKLSQDILSLTLTSLLPISLGSSHSKIECGAIKLEPKNGVALGEKSIALRTENLAVMGGGEINFANERLGVTLHPHARKTGKLNTKTAIKKVTIDGPFQDLTVKPHLGGIINQGISLTTKIANFGLSKIRVPLLDWAAPADVACMKSLH